MRRHRMTLYNSGLQGLKSRLVFGASPLFISNSRKNKYTFNEGIVIVSKKNGGVVCSVKISACVWVYVLQIYEAKHQAIKLSNLHYYQRKESFMHHHCP